MATKKEPGGEKTPKTPKIVFTEEHFAQAEECLKKNKKIIVVMKEVAYTKLPKSFAPSVVLD